MQYPNEASHPIVMTYVDGQWRLSWEAIEHLAKRVQIQMGRDLWRPKAIISLGRGGMIPARLWARGARVYYLGIKSYSYEQKGDQEKRGALNIYADINAERFFNQTGFDPSEILLADELVDSGNTMRFAAQKFPGCKTAALLSKVGPAEASNTNLRLDYCGLIFSDKRWIHFPWEE